MPSWYSITNASGDVADISIRGEIGFDGVTHSDFADELRSVTAKNITLYINSPGGSVDEGIGIYNSLRAHPAKVTAYVEAAAHSIASVILQGADRRIMAPHSRMMIHRAQAMAPRPAFGYDDDWEAVAVEAQQIAARLRDSSENIASIYSERSGKDTAYWLAYMKGEKVFQDKQAVAEGLADEVGRSYSAANFKIAANFDWAKFSNKADEIKAEFEAIADATGAPDLKAENERLTGEIARLEAELAAAKAIERIDPSDAARRELEDALARVKL